MKHFALAMLVLSLWTSIVRAEETTGNADALNPHLMLKADGEPDEEKCGLCHTDDLSLSNTKLETCTFCHPANPHAGAAQHLAADPADVKRRMAATKSQLPLAEEDKIYCGTCHVFHDPRITKEDVQSQRWLPSKDGLAGAVRESLEQRWLQAAQARDQKEAGATFSDVGTTRLRMPIDDGSLCKQCHEYGK